MKEFSLFSGRIELHCVYISMGSDVCILLTGGAAHIGAVSIGAESRDWLTFRRKEHRDDMLSELISKRLLEAGIVCVVVCGVHYDAITKSEIDETIRLASQGADILVNLYTKEKNGDNDVI